MERLARGVAYQNWNLGAWVGVGDWIVNRIFSQPATGFYALGLKSPSGQPPVLAIRGTDGLADFIDDANAKSVGYGQFINNRTSVESWLSSIAGQTGQAPAITGHSLGGALAQWFAADFTSQISNAALGDVVTFNSPGIDGATATRFVPAEAGRVMHYVQSGDLVSMAGDRFIAGQWTLANYAEPSFNPLTFILNKHGVPMLNASIGNRSRPAGLTTATYANVSWLNNPYFIYADAQYLSLIALATGAAEAAHLGAFPASLFFRSTTEAKRKQIGQFIEGLTGTLTSGNLEVSLPNVSWRITGSLSLAINGLHATYVGGADPYLKIQGGVNLAAGFNASADFTGSNFVRVDADGVDVVGTLSVGGLTIGGWGIKNIGLSVNTITDTLGGSVTVAMPGGVDVTGTMTFVGGRLNSIGLTGGPGMNKAIGTTGMFLQGIGGELDHISDGGVMAFTGTLDLTFGPQIDIDLPFWFPGGDVSGALLSFGGTGVIDSQHLSVHGDAALVGDLITGTGTLTFDWASGTLSADLSTSWIWGAVTTAQTFTANSNLDLTSNGNAQTARFPSGWPLLGGGKSLAGASTAFRYSNDGNLGDDFVAVWGDSLLGTLGFRIYFNGAVGRIGSAEAAELAPAAVPSATPAPSSPATYGLYAVPANSPWLLMAVDWTTTAAAASLVLTKPDGTTLAESQFDNAGVALVPELCGPGRRTVVVFNPSAGGWKVGVADATTLGTVSFAAATGTPVPVATVTIAGPALDTSGTTVPIPYNLANATAGTTVCFYYDTDRGGFDGVKLGETVGNNGAGSVNWSTAGVPAGDYYLYAQVIDALGTSSFSGYSTGRITVADPAAPAVVTGLSAVAGTATTALLRWDPPTTGTVDHYVVRLTSVASGEFYERTYAADTNQFTLVGLDPAGTYRVTVAPVGLGAHVGANCPPILLRTATTPAASVAFAPPGTAWSS